VKSMKKVTGSYEQFTVWGRVWRRLHLNFTLDTTPLSRHYWQEMVVGAPFLVISVKFLPEERE